LKEKRRFANMLCAVVCAMVGTAGTARSQASEPVLVLQERSQAQSGLIAALRIQLGATPVQVRDWPASGRLAERISTASELAQGAGAFAVVWTEPPTQLPDGAREVVLYIVGRRQGRAVLDVVRVPGGHGPDLDRTLALKVGEVLDELRQGSTAGPTGPTGGMLRESPSGPAEADGASAAAQTATVGSTPQTATTGSSPQTATAGSTPQTAVLTGRPSWGAAAWAGIRLGAELAPAWNRWGMGFGAGPVLQIDELAAAVRFGLDWYPPALRRSDDAGRVMVSELTPLVLTSGQWRRGDVAVGARTGAALAFLSAKGVAVGGAQGENSKRTLSWLIGIEIEQAITSSLAVAASVDMQLHALHRRFDLNDRTVADLGWMQLVFGLELVSRLR
jgi:hypothetical protein